MEKIEQKNLPIISSKSKFITVESSAPKYFNYDFGSFANCDFFDSVKFSYEDTKKSTVYFVASCKNVFWVFDENYSPLKKYKFAEKLICSRSVVLGGVNKETDPNVIGVVCQKQKNENSEIFIVRLDLTKTDIDIPTKGETLNFDFKKISPFTLPVSRDGGKTLNLAVGLFQWVNDPTKEAGGEVTLSVYFQDLEEGSRILEIKKPDSVKDFDIVRVISAGSGTSLSSVNNLLFTAFFKKTGEQKSQIGIFKVEVDLSTHTVKSFSQIPLTGDVNRLIPIDDDKIIFEDFQRKKIGFCKFDENWVKSNKIDVSSCKTIDNMGQKLGFILTKFSNCFKNSCGFIFSEPDSGKVNITQLARMKQDKTVDTIYFNFNGDDAATNDFEALLYRKEGNWNVFYEESIFVLEIKSEDLDPKQREYSIDLTYQDLTTETPIKKTLEFAFAEKITDSQSTEFPIDNFEGFLKEAYILPTSNKNIKGNALSVQFDSGTQNTDVEVLHINKINYYIQDEIKKADAVIPIGQGIIASINNGWWYYYCDVKLGNEIKLSCSYKVDLKVSKQTKYASSKRYKNVILIQFRDIEQSQSIIVVYDEFIKTLSKVLYKEISDFINNYYFQGDKFYVTTLQKSGSGYSQVMVQNSYTLPKFVQIFQLKNKTDTYKTLSTRIRNEGDTIFEVVAIKQSLVEGENQLQFKLINLNEDESMDQTIPNSTYNFSDNYLNRIAISSKVCLLHNVVVFVNPNKNIIAFARVKFNHDGQTTKYVNTRILDLTSLGMEVDFQFYCFDDVGFVAFTATKKNEKGEVEYYLVVLSRKAIDDPEGYIKVVQKLKFEPEVIHYSNTDKHLFFEILTENNSQLLSMDLKGPRFSYMNKGDKELQSSLSFTYTDSIYQSQTKKFSLKLDLKAPVVQAKMTKISSLKLEQKQFPIYSLLNIDGPEGQYSLSKQTNSMKIVNRLQNNQGEKLKGPNGSAISPKTLKMVKNGDVFGLLDSNLNTILVHWLDNNFKAIHDINGFCEAIQIETISITKYIVYMICSEERIKRPKVVLYDTQNEELKTILVKSEYFTFDIGKVNFIRIDENSVWLLIQCKFVTLTMRGKIDVSASGFDTRIQELKDMTMMQGKKNFTSIFEIFFKF